MRATTVTLADAENLPRWRRPESLLILVAFAMPVAFATWSALLNNFVIEMAGFTGVEIGWLHTVREIPGFLAIGVILLLLFIREQILGVIALILLGCATAVTAYFPSFDGILFVTLFSSIGFHYFETVNQSLQLQWIDRARAPQMLGWLVAVGLYNVTPLEYVYASAQALTLPHVLIGLLKGTVYAVLVALAGCLQGMSAGRSAQAVGDATTAAVVQAIVWMVVAASVLTVVFQQLDW